MEWNEWKVSLSLSYTRQDDKRDATKQLQEWDAGIHSVWRITVTTRESDAIVEHCHQLLGN